MFELQLITKKKFGEKVGLSQRKVNQKPMSPKLTGEVNIPMIARGQKWIAPETARGQQGVLQIPMQGVTNPALGPLVHQEIHSAIPTRRNMVVTSETLRIKVKKIRMTNIMSQLGKAIL